MWNIAGNVFFALQMAATFLIGVALFLIARQDESRLGRILGITLTVLALFELAYLTFGNHWL